jgi:3,4-dihydroxy 2-butanone 4-phosphate synthase/GTP cyclohydrolase II
VTAPGLIVVPRVPTRSRAEMFSTITDVPKSVADEPAVESTKRAIQAMRRGELVIVRPDAAPGGALVMAGEAATRTSMAFMIRHTSGLVCVAMKGDRLDHLAIPPMVSHSSAEERPDVTFAVAVDAADGITTGISAADRAVTTRLLASPGTTASDLVRPGHVLPLRAHEAGVLKRRGFAEAAVDLALLAGLQPVGVLAEIMDDDGQAPRDEALDRFAELHQLQQVSVDDLVQLRLTQDALVEHVSRRLTPMPWGEVVVDTFESLLDHRQHLALTIGNPASVASPLIGVHFECVAGDVFASRSCDCRGQLLDSLRAMAREGAGVMIYLRGEEAHDSSNRSLGHQYAVALSAEMLTTLGIAHVQLLAGDGPVPSPQNGYTLGVEDSHSIRHAEYVSGDLPPRPSGVVGELHGRAELQRAKLRCDPS